MNFNKLLKSRKDILALISKIAKRNYAIHEVKMPAQSPTMKTGVIKKWNVSVGDEVSEGDSLADLETDKAVISIDTQEPGFVGKILLKEGIPTEVGKIIALLVDEKSELKDIENYKLTSSSEGEQKEEVKETKKEEVKESKKEEVKETKKEEVKQDSGRVFASPLAKNTASEKGVSLNEIQGTGPNNRIIKSDVDEFVKVSSQQKAQSVKPTSSTPAAVPQSQTKYEDIAISQVRRVIANRLFESKSTIPHYYLTIECEIDALLKARQHLNDSVGSKQGFKLSVNDFVIKAAGRALNKVPQLNSSWMGDYIRQYKQADISVAVQTETGLITPIVTNVNGKGLAEISNTVKSLAKKARESALQPHEFQGGSFTISNLGMFGVTEFAAIINPPQSAILAVGTAVKSVKPHGDGFKSVTTMKVTLSCDHRVVDGAVGASWLQSFKENIEDPLNLLL